MFYRVKKSQREAKSNLRPEETNPKIHHPVLFSPQTKKSRSSLSYPVISSFSFPKQKSRSSCLHPVILSTHYPVHPVKNSNPIEIYIPLLLE